jgi:hypothetical protein
MNNHKLDIYKELKLNDYYWGGALRINFEKIDLNSTSIVINILDKVCEDEGFKALNEAWNEIDYNQFKTILLSAFQFNLGFTKHETMPPEKAQWYYKSVLEYFNTESCRCFTNWFNNPWDNISGGSAITIFLNHFSMAPYRVLSGTSLYTRSSAFISVRDSASGYKIFSKL